MVFPQNNLNGDAVPWGRAIQDGIVETGKALAATESKLNNSVRATSGQLSLISRQLDTLQTQQAELAVQQSEILETTTFLLGQKSAVSNSASDNWTASPALNSGQVTLPYNASVDLSMTVTTSTSGRFQVDLTSFLQAFAASGTGGSSVSITAYVFVEVLSGGTVAGSPTVIETTAQEDAGGGTTSSATTVSSFGVFTGAPNTA